MTKKTMHEKLARMRVAYAQKLDQKTANIQSGWQDLLTHWNSDSLDALYRQVHNLAGSGSTFGFPDISSSAQTLQTLLYPLRDGNLYPTREEMEEIGQAHRHLVQILRQSSLETGGGPAPVTSVFGGSSVATASNPSTADLKIRIEELYRFVQDLQPGCVAEQQVIALQKASKELRELSAGLSAPAMAHPESSPFSRGRMMLIEPDPFHRKVCLSLTRQLGIDTVLFEDPGDALDRVAEYDWILLSTQVGATSTGPLYAVLATIPPGCRRPQLLLIADETVPPMENHPEVLMLKRPIGLDQLRSRLTVPHDSLPDVALN